MRNLLKAFYAQEPDGTLWAGSQAKWHDTTGGRPQDLTVTAFQGLSHQRRVDRSPQFFHRLDTN